MRISDWSSDVCSSDLQSSGGSSPRHRLCEQHAFHPSSFSASVLTKVKWNCVPPPCAGSIQMRPPLASTIVRQIERPSPMPSAFVRSEEHTSELQSLMRISYAVFCLNKKTKNTTTNKYIIISTT